MFVIVETGSASIEEADPKVELFRSEVVARLALARKFAALMRKYHKDYGIKLSKREATLLTRLERLTVFRATNRRYWNFLKSEMDGWHEDYRTDMDFYSTFWIIEAEPGKNPLRPAHVPGLPDR